MAAGALAGAAGVAAGALAGVADVLVYNPEKKKLAVVVGKSKNKEFSISFFT